MAETEILQLYRIAEKVMLGKRLPIQVTHGEQTIDVATFKAFNVMHTQYVPQGKELAEVVSTLHVSTFGSKMGTFYINCTRSDKPKDAVCIANDVSFEDAKSIVKIFCAHDLESRVEPQKVLEDVQHSCSGALGQRPRVVIVPDERNGMEVKGTFENSLREIYGEACSIVIMGRRRGGSHTDVVLND